jgi:hypothetical protein
MTSYNSAIGLVSPVRAILAVLSSTVPLLISTSAVGQDTLYSEEHTAQNYGGDRLEYLQEMEHSDPAFYVPPLNDGDLPANNNNESAN